MKKYKILLPLLLAAALTACGNASSTPVTSSTASQPAASQADTSKGAASQPATSQADTSKAGTATPDTSQAETSSGTPTNGRLADASEKTAAIDVTEEWMVPIYAENVAEGTYDIDVDSSSSMFRIASCKLHSANGNLTAEVTIGSDSYTYLYPGTAEEAVHTKEANLITYTTNADGSSTFVFPVEALDKGLPCAAMSRKKEAWYDRTLVFRADSLPEGVVTGFGRTAEDLALADGSYTADISLYGGSGRARLRTPAPVLVRDGKLYVTVVFESPNYDYIIVGGEKYLPLTEADAAGAGLVSPETSVFQVPFPYFDHAFVAHADTTAMSEPHEIEYHLLLSSDSLSEEGIFVSANSSDISEKTPTPKDSSNHTKSPAGSSENAGAAKSSSPNTNSSAGSFQSSIHLPDSSELPSLLKGKTPTEQMSLAFAKGFALWKYPGDIDLLLIGEDRYLLLPKDYNLTEAPEGYICLQKPLERTYLASSSAMDFFLRLDAADCLRATSTRAQDWTHPEVQALLANGSLLYVGKYSAPDYELLLTENVTVAIENTMILHAPKVREQLVHLGIPVLVERSSYEEHPLGRLEWIRLFGRLTGREAEADAFFNEARARYEAVEEASRSNAEKVFAIFSINAAGQFVVRRPGDYLVNLLTAAGSRYAFGHLGKSTGDHATMAISAEEFYAAAKDADLLIYNGAITGEAESLAALLAKNPLLANFSAFRSANVYALGSGIFQHPTAAADLLTDFAHILKGEATEDASWVRKLD